MDNTSVPLKGSFRMWSTTECSQKDTFSSNLNVVDDSKQRPRIFSTFHLSLLYQVITDKDPE